MNIILRFLLNALAILLISKFLPGFSIESFYTALIVALVLGVINVTIKPVLLLLTLPINILSLGLFTFVINALMLLLASSIVKGFDVENFLTALIAALLISVFNIIIKGIGKSNTALHE